MKIYPDDDIENADWPKQTRDIYAIKDGKAHVVTKLDELSEVTGIPKAKLKKLPVVTLRK